MKNILSRTLLAAAALGLLGASASAAVVAKDSPAYEQAQQALGNGAGTYDNNRTSARGTSGPSSVNGAGLRCDKGGAGHGENFSDDVPSLAEPRNPLAGHNDGAGKSKEGGMGFGMMGMLGGAALFAGAAWLLGFTPFGWGILATAALGGAIGGALGWLVSKFF